MFYVINQIAHHTVCGRWMQFTMGEIPLAIGSGVHIMHCNQTSLGFLRIHILKYRLFRFHIRFVQITVQLFPFVKSIFVRVVIRQFFLVESGDKLKPNAVRVGLSIVDCFISRCKISIYTALYSLPYIGLIECKMVFHFVVVKNGTT